MIKKQKTFIPSLDMILEDYYEYEVWNEKIQDYVYSDKNCRKIVIAWSSLIHDVDIYYKRFIEYIKECNEENE